MSAEERLEALYKLLGSCMMVRCLASEKERLAMDLTTAKIDQIESRTARMPWQKG